MTPDDLRRRFIRIIVISLVAGGVWIHAGSNLTGLRAAQQGAQASEIFKDKVARIFEQNCIMCHGARVQRSGLDLRTEEAVLKGGSRGAAVIPGDPDKSLLFKLIAHREEPAMPMGMDKLGEADIAAVKQWIEALPKVPMAAEETAPVRQPGYAVTDDDRQFWSFVKPVRPEMPRVRDRKWVRNEIDAFILSKLEENGLRPAPEADPRTLLRRIYFDLTGLPPSPAEIANFLRDPSDEAYRQVVEKLLASPRYGERWGRHWLDLARYADSGGYEFDVDRPHAWRYRDYVIRAFNDDKPYDQFVREQLANDQFRPGDTEALIATGFCRNGPTVDNANNEETRMDELDDMVTTTSSVFLGLTVGCARCHDHKYDPIPQRDYYRMQAVFFPFEKADRVLVPKDEVDAFRRKQKEIDALVKPYRARIAAIEKPVRERLLAEKVDFHVRLAQSTGSLEGKSLEQFREETARRFAKDVNLQPEEIEALLSPGDLQARKEIQKEIDRINATRPAPLPAVMGISDKSKPGQAHLLIRGNWRQKGEAVGPGYPTLFSKGLDLDPLDRRRQLADWIVSPDNPLTARVAVNRIWQYHFGMGLVRTPSDFGATGDRPSHPDLLDWLAVEFVARGWSWKQIHRLITLSSAYRQSSRFDQSAAAKDPENKLVWRFSPRRLEAESIRDTILASSGKLNLEMYGPGIYPRIDPDVVNTGSRPRWPLGAREGPDVWRRSVYIYVKRSVLLPLIEVFDCPVTTVSAPSRAVSTVSPQALALMNNEFVLEQAGYFADRVMAEAGADQSRRIDAAYRIAFGRSPNRRELGWSLDFLKSQAEGYARRKDADPGRSALRDFCHALFNTNEFVYLFGS
ncbi:MAG: DUF1549 domain-containing protein [Acidobacteriota bacterium]|nr:MAG: DUF1549 domain-containing protein [Acidobacteriota bacterium]